MLPGSATAPDLLSSLCPATAHMDQTYLSLPTSSGIGRDENNQQAQRNGIGSGQAERMETFEDLGGLARRGTFGVSLKG